MYLSLTVPPHLYIGGDSVRGVRRAITAGHSSLGTISNSLNPPEL